MDELTSLLEKCSAAFTETEEYRILDTYRSRDNRLTLDERLAIFKVIELTFQPVFQMMRRDNPSLTDTDLIFCALSVQGFETVAIAECLTVSKEAIRTRKFRLHEKLNDRWQTLIFGERKRYNSDSATLHTGPDDEVPLPLPAEPINHAKVMKETMSFGKAVSTCFSKLFTFDGRARRSEFWYYQLFIYILQVLLTLTVSIVKLIPTIGSGNYQPVNSNLFFLIDLIVSTALFLLTLSVDVRRLHDIECSGWMILPLKVIPFILGGIMLLFKYSSLTFQDGGYAPNEVVEILSTFIIIFLLTIAIDIIKIVLYCKPGTEGPNSYGPDPIRIIRDSKA